MPDSRFHYLMLALVTLMQIGGVIDARTHVHHGFSIESFFVPAHYVLYAAWVGVLVSVSSLAWSRRRQGRSRAEWLPPGYGWAALGAALFGFSGAFDAFWHSVFGFELNLQVLLSPAHLILFLAIGFIYYSVVCHADHHFRLTPERHQRSLAACLPLVIGLASLFMIVFWPCWYFDPLAADYAARLPQVAARSAYRLIEYGTPTAEITGVGGILLTALVVVPFVVVPLYRWRLPSGSLAIMFAWVYLQRAVILGVYQYLVAVALAALAGEAVWAWMHRGGEARLASPFGYRVIAFAVPLALFGGYFLMVALASGGIAWPVHLWAGSMWMAAVAGVLLTLVLVPGVHRLAPPAGSR